jgi:hypothetical protein
MGITLAEHLQKIAAKGGKTMTERKRAALALNLQKARAAKAAKRRGQVKDA